MEPEPQRRLAVVAPQSHLLLLAAVPLPALRAQAAE
jgi:hypothetical protein